MRIKGLQKRFALASCAFIVGMGMYMQPMNVNADEVDDQTTVETTEESGIKIDSANIASAQLRKLANYDDYNGDGILSESEANYRSDITLKNATQAEVTQAIKLYPNLTSIEFNGGTFTSMKLNSSKITNVYVTTTATKLVKVTGVSKLEYLSYAYKGKKDISLNFNSFNLYKTAKSIEITGSHLTGVTAPSGVKTFRMYTTGVKKLSINSNSKLENLDVYDNKKLKEITVNKCSKLKYVYVPSNALTTLNIKSCSAIVDLSCRGNKLKAVDVTKLKKLTQLNCIDNKLSSLNTKKNTKLTSLLCSANSIKKLDTTSNKKLISLVCYDNKLTTINLKNNKELYAFSINENYQLLKDLSGIKEIHLTMKKGSKLDLKKYAPFLKNAKFSMGQKVMGISVNKKGVISISKKCEQYYTTITAKVGKKEYLISVRMD
ncbi:internalin-like protein [Lachnospiraceae bacterium KM106-2]|nr:internalin-like protein [Lachnospiraceae bacterium KM106-2]